MHEKKPRLTRKRKIKLYLLSFAFLGLVFGAFAFLGEMVLRYLALSGSEESRDHVIMTDRLPATFKPNYAGVIWDVPFTTNRYGFRGEEDFPADPPENEIRVLSLGDSIGFGLGIDAEDHYAKVAQRRLQPFLSDHRLRIVNAGGQGYSPSSYAVALQTQGLALRPDMVVLEIELCNDVTDEALIGRVFDRPSIEKLPTAVTGGRYVVGWDGNLLATYSVGPYLFERTYLWTDLLRRWLNLSYRWDPNEPFANHPELTYYTLGFDRPLLTPERIESGWAGMFDALEGIHRLLEPQGVEFLLMIMPSRYIYQDRPLQREFALKLKNQAVMMARERGLPYLDMTEAIERGGGAALYFDFAHLTREGNRVVGARLAQALAPLLRREE